MAMATELHQRLVDQLATKRLLDNPRLRAALQAVRREHFLPGSPSSASTRTTP
jgi:hypothetical protein